ncbi:hypothetical protein QIS99_31620 [Streptomyces sp. B-S-A8]|uniref:Uncharacterized protein n=1 Tax=Streptomyces solicavernae TaxID=3043614 RepID=A0ABT6S1Z7_9ACTN|nr:hypothetical protein [Streptomyces sp. B-S-A8]MDI3390711.1 hypothetical protein [Streptomyces sp. B-S-A8]
MIKVQTSEGTVELQDEERFLLRGILREIRQASYLFEEDDAWAELLELSSAVRAERTSPEERVEVSAEQMERLGELTNQMLEHLGAEEFHTRTGATSEKAQELMHRLTART